MRFLAILLTVLLMLTESLSGSEPFVSMDLKNKEIKNLDSKLIIQILFELNKEAMTTTDFKIYLNTKHELKIKNLLTLVQNELEEFVLFNLVYLEVKNIELRLTHAESLLYKNEHQKKMILVLNYLSSKERHLTQLNRYKVWTDILKRKYNYLPRIDELRN